MNAAPIWKVVFHVIPSIMAALIAFGIVIPFAVYSIIPNLTEIAAVLYAFAYGMAVYLQRERLQLPRRRRNLLRVVLAGSGFFMTGLLLDLLEGIPQASVSFSILLVDFYPSYLACVGGAVAVWAVRGLHEIPEPLPALAFRGDVLAGLPVTRREREISNLILAGETNASIAERLFIAESTVKKHVNDLFRKLRISSRWELLKLTERPPREE